MGRAVPVRAGTPGACVRERGRIRRRARVLPALRSAGLVGQPRRAAGASRGARGAPPPRPVIDVIGGGWIAQGGARGLARFCAILLSSAARDLGVSVCVQPPPPPRWCVCVWGGGARAVAAWPCTRAACVYELVVLECELIMCVCLAQTGKVLRTAPIVRHTAASQARARS